MEIKELFNRNELRRLEKAAKEKDKKKLAEWAGNFEQQVINEYEGQYQEILENSIENFLIALVYTLHFNEKTRFGNDRIADFMSDLMATVDCFKTGEYSPEEFKKILEKQKIYFKE